MTQPKILVFAGSIRTGALSGKLAALAAKEIALADGDVTHISLADYPLPIYDGDLEKEKGIPENAQQARPPDRRPAGRLHRHAGIQPFAAAAPQEHHRLDQPRPRRHWHGINYRHKVYGIGSTSDGPIGGARALIDLRRVLTTALGGIVIPEKIEVRAPRRPSTRPASSSTRRREDAEGARAATWSSSPGGWRTERSRMRSRLTCRSTGCRRSTAAPHATASRPATA